MAMFVIKVVHKVVHVHNSSFASTSRYTRAPPELLRSKTLFEASQSFLYNIIINYTMML
jgi:hypothetical protein